MCKHFVLTFGYIVVQIGVLIHILNATTLEINDECVVSRTKESGLCKFADDCPHIITQILEQSLFPTLCGFKNAKEIICCPAWKPVYNQNTSANLVTIQQKVFTGVNLTNRISAQKCLEYQKTCTPNAMSFNFISGDAKPKEFPYAAVLGHVNVSDPSGEITWLCGASVISEHFVLTVAQCVKNGEKSVKYVRLGDLNYESDRDDHEARQFNVIEIFVHPFFRKSKKYDNIALLKIDGPIEFGEYIRPICLTDFNTNISEHLITAGWGKSNYIGDIHSRLQTVKKTLVPHAECIASYVERITSQALDKGIINEKQICAVAKQGAPDACQGFSGSALINTDEKQSCLYEIVGITSFGVSCGIGVPRVYTRVAGYLDWIEDIVWHGRDGSSTVISPEEPKITFPSVDRPLVRKCNEYQSALAQRPLNTANISHNSRQNIFQCPLSVISYVVDGENALGREFPHMALVGFDVGNGKISWPCGGSLISEHFVLTAAHCIHSIGLGFAKYVLLGELDYATDDDDAQPLQVNVAERIKHPEFTGKFRYNDIALLRLDERVPFNNYIYPICLPDSSSIPFSAVATGWGKLDFNRAVSSHLQKVELDLFTHKECDDLYTVLNSKSIDRGIINDTQICAGTHNGRGDTCQGDSGGPLQISHDKHSCMYTVIGITSFGIFCGSEYPGVYTRVFSFIDWIESVVWPNSTET